MAAPVQHHDPVGAGPYIYQPLGYQQLTAAQLASAVGLPGLTDNVTCVLIQVEGTPGTDTVRWRDDGQPPTTALGMLMNGTNTDLWPPFMYSGNLSAIQFIAAAGSPKINISYYR
jgi:hypothetical protein